MNKNSIFMPRFAPTTSLSPSSSPIPSSFSPIINVTKIPSLNNLKIQEKPTNTMFLNHPKHPPNSPHNYTHSMAYSPTSSRRFIPLSLNSICACQSRRPSQTLSLTRPSSLKVKICVDGSRGFLGILRGRHQQGTIIVKVARAEREFVDDGEQPNEEVNEGFSLPPKQNSDVMKQQNANQLTKRIVFGLGIGISAGGVVLIGGWVFAVALTAAIFIGAREYFELVRSRGIAAGMTPPPRYVSRVCSVICALMPIVTLYLGQIDVSVTSAAFIVAMTLLLQRGNPRFAQLSSAVFGLFYCGYLPCFWIKLRCGLSAPALNTRVGAVWPVLFGGQAHWTVGLVATLMSISSVIAADTFAFAGGKAFGRTPLTSISPKKTWEGVLAGLAGCVATTVFLAKIFSWPTSVLGAVAFGFLNFFGSLFGDLIESMIKRDAGVKDSGSLIPGHGGILDRTDSYIFTGALAYAFAKNLIPLYGV